MKHIAVVVTARPSWARVCTLVEALLLRECRVSVVLTGAAVCRDYGDLRGDVGALGIEPVVLPTLLDARTPYAMVSTTALTMQAMGQWLTQHRPDVVVSIADRYETLGTAIAARYQGLTLAHIQGGEVSGNIDDRVRDAVTQLADLHFPATQKAAARILSLRPSAKVWTVGCPAVDLAHAIQYAPAPACADLGGTGVVIDTSRPYVVVLQHSVTEHWGKAEAELDTTIGLVEDMGYPVVWFWPNVDAGSDGASKALRLWKERGPRIPVHWVRHCPASVFLRLVHHSIGLIGNSSVGIRECSYLGVPVLNIGDRQQGRERGPNVKDWPEIPEWGRTYPSSHLYGSGDAGARIAEVLLE